MPAIRWMGTIHPTTGQEGLWIEPNWLPRGTIRGLAKTAWPAPNGGETIPAFKTRLESLLATGFRLSVAVNPVRATVVVTSLAPVTVDFDSFTIQELDSVSR